MATVLDDGPMGGAGYRYALCVLAAEEREEPEKVQDF